MSQQTPDLLDGDEAAIRLIGDAIAKSRYESWDPRAQGPDAVPWDEYRVRYGSVAENIYVEDGHRDARRLLPLMHYVANQGAVNALREAAHHLAGDNELDAATTVLGRANRLDWRRPTHGEER